MNIFLGFLLGIAASVIGGLLQPSVRRVFVGLATVMYVRFVPGHFSLSGLWETTYEGVDANGGKRTFTERVQLKQSGLRVSGTSTFREEATGPFHFEGELFGDTVHGSFLNLDLPKGALHGRGVFLLSVLRDRKRMTGFCAWIASETADKPVEPSRYEWVKL